MSSAESSPHDAPEPARSISAESTRDLRHRVLRPHQTPADCVYPLDHKPSSGHFGVTIDDRPVAVGSIFKEDPDDGGPFPGASWRIRGMATEPSRQGRGLGGEVLKALLHHARSHGGKYVWCNGRTTVESFYSRHGLAAQGDVFDLPGLGPHLVMAKNL